MIESLNRFLGITDKDMEEFKNIKFSTEKIKLMKIYCKIINKKEKNCKYYEHPSESEIHKEVKK